MLLDEAVIGTVLVEGPDDVVPISPQMRLGVVDGAAAGVGVARQIQPVPAPVFPVAGIGQQLFHLLPVGLRRRIGQEPLHGFGRGWETDQTEVEASQQAAGRDRPGRFQLLLFQLGQHEGIDRVSHPLLVPDRGDLGLGDGSPGPNRLGGILCGLGHQGGIQLIDPAGDALDLLLGKRLPVHGHAGGASTAQALDQRAFLAVAGDDGRSLDGAALQKSCDRLNHQAALVSLGAVAGLAVLFQQRLDMGLEISGGSGPCGPVLCCRRRHLVDPPGDQGDLGFRERIASHRHLRLELAPQVADQGASGAVSGQDRGTGLLAPLEHGLHRFHHQAALGRGGGVAGKALFLKNGLDVSLKVDRGLSQDVASGQNGQDRPQ